MNREIANSAEDPFSDRLVYSITTLRTAYRTWRSRENCKANRLTREAWIRQLKRLSQQCWKVSTEFKLPDSLKMQEHTMSTMMLLGMTFVDPVATIAGRQIRISETQ
jgi:hypothetical protein